MNPCIQDKFTLCKPEFDPRKALELSIDLMRQFDASPYDTIGVAIAFGADPREAKRAFGVEISGNVKKPIATFLASYGRRHGYEKVEAALLKLYQAAKGDCLCPPGPIAPLGDDYIVQRPYAVYICASGNCREVTPEPLQLYEHPTGCMFYNPALVLEGQPLPAVVNALKQLKVTEPEIVAKYLLPGLCRDLWGVAIP